MVTTRAHARIQGFGDSVFTRMTALARQYDAVNLGQGFPDFPGPGFVKDAAKQAIDADLNQYAISSGAPRLKQQVAIDYSVSFGREIDPAREVVVTNGATEAIFDAIQAFTGPGDEIVAFEPFYDSYPASAAIAGATFVPVRLNPPDWRFDLDAFARAITPRTRVLLLNTPHNPTGKVFSREELEQIAALAIDRDILVITDEVYDRIVYAPAQHISIASLPGMWERTISINSTGKTFSMTGWKIGYAVGPAELVGAIQAVHQFVTFASPTPFQDAMASAMEQSRTNGYYDQLRRDYTHRRDLLAAALAQVGFTTLPVSGSYFLMADIADRGFETDLAFCEWLVEAAGVVALPPSAFYQDPSTAPLLARFCFAKSDATIAAAAERLRAIG
ncbi:MAG: aminotransferase class I/II-fold pyridoxal phosphate-dependent enzyme [Thermomicrobiales bacterium]|nr:aminotransferase class I/II-fold pyridoxal phosphate-dependent enzyme [Thermomicrobiales bacterium]MCO5220984.1 aminotransferase class I/II-fold pyridoxal phosphate-dependent enzyme [Thermomicrobiales bacterium]